MTNAPRTLGLPVFVALATLAPLACSDSSGKVEKESQRLWGRERIAQEVEKRAKESLDPYLLGEKEELRKRVLEMDIDEVVARLGFVEYRGVAKFELTGTQSTIALVEDTLIQHGLHGSFRVLQRDGGGNVTRETFFNNGVYYLRNGGGEMRVQGVIDDHHHTARDEAFQPLRIYAAYFGPRLRLRKLGNARAEGRSAAKYALELGPGPELVTVEGMDGAKRPVSLSGELFVDEATAVPIKLSMRGALEVPSAKGNPPGKLNVELDYTMKVVDGVELKPKSFVPTIKRHPVDLEPLAFLDGGTRTSTVIGGKRSKAAKAEKPTRTATSTGDRGGEP